MEEVRNLLNATPSSCESTESSECSSPELSDEGKLVTNGAELEESCPEPTTAEEVMAKARTRRKTPSRQARNQANKVLQHLKTLDRMSAKLQALEEEFNSKSPDQKLSSEDICGTASDQSSSEASFNEDYYVPQLKKKRSKQAQGPLRKRRKVLVNPSCKVEKVEEENQVSNEEIRWTLSYEHQIEALATYRALHGSCTVPLSFKIPQTPSKWPQHLRGVPLGAIVASLRNSYDAFIVRTLFDDLGFVWAPKRIDVRCVHVTKRCKNLVTRSWPQVVSALEQYRTIHKNLDISEDFIIPHDSNGGWTRAMWGISLGLVIPAIDAHIYEIPDTEIEKLNELGLLSDLPKWEQVYSWLQLYKRYRHRCDVPIDYVIEQGNGWPLAAEDQPLGELAWKIGVRLPLLANSRKKDLKRLGYTMSTDRTWARVLYALYHYQKLQGNTDVPYDFDIPKSDEPEAINWPATLHEMRLGYFYARLLAAAELKFLPQDCVEILEKLQNGCEVTLPWHQVDYEKPNVKIVKPEKAPFPRGSVQDSMAQASSPAINQSTPAQVSPPLSSAIAQVTTHFSAPSSVDINEDTSTHFSPPSPTTFSQNTRVESSTAIGQHENDSPSAYDALTTALRQYKALFKSMDIPEDYTIPLGDSSWPSSLWDYKLGKAVEVLRAEHHTLTNTKKRELYELGFIWNPPVYKLWPDLCAFLSALRNRITTHQETQILPGADWYTASLTKEQLGYYWTILEIHEDFASVEHRKKLSELGFDFQGRWKTKLSALSVFYKLYCHLQVPENFTVPQEQNWPHNTWGLSLGPAVQWIRQCQNAIYIDHRKELEELHFEFNPVNLDLVEPGIRAFRSHFGDDAPLRSDFVIPVDDSWPENLRGTQLGALFGKREAYLNRMEQLHFKIMDALGIPSSGKFLTSNHSMNPIWEGPWYVLGMALEEYFDTHGSFDVPLLFYISVIHGKWNKRMQGMPLGFIAYLCRTKYDKLRPHVQRSLENIKFPHSDEPHITINYITQEPQSLSSDITSIQIIESIGGDVDDIDIPISLTSQHNFNNNVHEAPSTLVWPNRPVLPEWPPEFTDVNALSQLPQVSMDVTAFCNRGEKQDNINFDDADCFQWFMEESLSENPNDIHTTNPQLDEENSTHTLPKSTETPKTSWKLELNRDVQKTEVTLKTLLECGELAGSSQKVPFSSLLSPVLMVKALQTYYQIHEHLDIPMNFTVPDKSLVWPSEMWGLPLGWFWSHPQEAEFKVFSKNTTLETLRSAFEVYRAKTGHASISPAFQIPEFTTEWPRALWNLKLGTAALLIASSPTLSRFPEFESCFSTPSVVDMDWDKFFVGLYTYKETYNSIDVPPNFVVPIKDWKWPEDLWGYALGNMIEKISTGHVALTPSSLERLQRLEPRWLVIN